MTLPTLSEPLRVVLRARIEAAIAPLEGWTSVDKGTRMAELVLTAGVESSVELGVFGGRGTISLAIGHEARGSGRVLAIDPWRREASLEGVNDPANDDWWGKLDHEAIYAGFIAALARTGTADYVRVVRQRSMEAVDAVPDASVDLLHQDSNHSEAVSTAEVDRWAPKIAPRGLWIADDTDWATTQRAQRRILELGFELVEDHTQWRVYRRP
ncbi:MAG: class I SAM-dependent methyltransferase [Burkholderiales bacterium]